MVYRKRNFTESDGEKFLAATGVFRRALFEAQDNAPFNSEIFDALDGLFKAVRHVEGTITGDPGFRCSPQHSTSMNPAPPKILKLRTWKPVPLWKQRDQKN
jgi:hypothetical protein